MTNPSNRYKNREIPTNQEIDAAIAKADEISNDYFRLRVKALIALAKKFGKRRKEIAIVEVADVRTERHYLIVTFTIVKKHKKGLFQYFRFLKRSDPDGLNKPYPQLVEDWKAWRETELGQRVRTERRTKKVNIRDRYAKMILEYRDYVKANFPKAKFLFPSGKAVFQNYVVDEDNHLSGRQLLRLIKPLDPTLWLHLLRETKGAEISRDLGMNITAVTEVKNMLDLEREETAWNYVRRYAVQEAKAET
jgi:integrase